MGELKSGRVERHCLHLSQLPIDVNYGQTGDSVDCNNTGSPLLVYSSGGGGVDDAGSAAVYSLFHSQVDKSLSLFFSLLSAELVPLGKTVFLACFWRRCLLKLVTHEHHQQQ